MNKVFVTGGSGFVGRSIVGNLLLLGYPVLAHSRAGYIDECENVHFDLNDLNKKFNFLKNISYIVHCAAKVHQMSNYCDALESYRNINVNATINLAKQAAAAGVKRFIFISSIKVNGESTSLGNPFTEHVEYPPADPYGLSKYEAEQALLQLAQETEMEVVIIRPPLMYGPGVKANFASMISWIKKGLPLPLAGLDNKRSLLSLKNLCNFVELVLTHPAAKNEVFLVSDGNDLSTSELLYQLGESLHQPARLFYIPRPLLSIVGNLLGQQSKIDRLCDSLQLDISKAVKTLDWHPPYTLRESLIDMDCQG